MMAYLAFQIFYLADGPNPMTYLGSLEQASQILHSCVWNPLVFCPKVETEVISLYSLSTIITFFSSLLGASLDFVIALYSALPLPVIVGLVYRISQ
jgi:hypothetical protein